MAIKTILVKFLVDTDQLDKVESDYKGDYQNQLRSALGWAAKSGIIIDELYPDPLKEFCKNEALFRLQEYHGFSEYTAKCFVPEISEVINETINNYEDLYDCIDQEIDDYLDKFDITDIIVKTINSYEVILEDGSGNYSFGLQDASLLSCIKDAEMRYSSSKYSHVYVDGCLPNGNENIPIWSDGEYEDENTIKEAILKIGRKEDN